MSHEHEHECCGGHDLMTVAVMGALAIHQWSEGAAVTFLFALSEMLEAFSLARARKAVQSLMQLTPETALLKDGADFCEVPVEQVGVGATIAGHEYFVGNHRFTHELAVCSAEIEQQLAEIEADAQSVVVVGHKPHAGCKGEVLGILAVGDAMRANAPEAIAALHRAGIAKIIMLSGDNQRTASAIAKRAGIDEAHGDLLPDQKIERVQALLATERYVGMIGDGVNDAPAMTRHRGMDKAARQADRNDPDQSARAGLFRPAFHRAPGS